MDQNQFSRRRLVFGSLLAGAAILFAYPGRAASPIRVMLLDGQQSRSHPWEPTSPALKKMLEEAGLFQVDQVTSPPVGGDFSKFKPAFAKYQVVVLNYDTTDDQWPTDLKASFEQYVQNGGGLVVFHGADNSFPGWRAFNLMIGIGGWRGRNEKSGPLWYFKDGKLVSDTPRTRGRPRSPAPLSGCDSRRRPSHHQGLAQSLDARGR
jgi:hypothetical protein